VDIKASIWKREENKAKEDENIFAEHWK
jgi:hypothetical protein